MKLLRIVSDGTSPGTTFETFDPLTGNVEPVELPVRQIRWSLDADDVAHCAIEFDMVSLNIMQPSEPLVNRINEQIVKLARLRDSLMG